MCVLNVNMPPNKVLKKIRGKEHMIRADNSDIVFSDEPQLHVAILNTGLPSGINTESVIEEVSKHAQLADFILLPNKSYCFLKFYDKTQSQCVYEAMNGVTKLAQNDSPLLMSYCETIPSAIDCSPWNCAPPKGLILIEDVISAEIEEKMMNDLKWEVEDESTDSSLKHRKVQHFGYEFIYGSNSVDPSSPLANRKIPEECDAIWKFVSSKYPVFENFKPDQLTVNRYEPGNGIPPHCDTHSCFQDPVVSLSLGSSIVMEFKQPDSQKQTTVLLPRRSLLIMSGESRYGWTHAIKPRLSDIVVKPKGNLTLEPRKLRISFTFRQLKIPRECSCSFSSLCDVSKPTDESANQAEVEVADHLAAKLEIENVHKVYNEIGSHFSETRHSPWPNVENFISNIPNGAILLDVGCGNGKYLGLNENITKLGCDRSDALLNVCVERKFNVFQCDCLEVPIRNDSVDACISIAVIHHLATSDRRLRAIENMVRVLVKGGTALIYVWARDQQKENKKSSYLMQHHKKDSEKPQMETAAVTIDDSEIQLPVHRNRTQFQNANVLVPWKLKQKEIPHDQQKVFLRYYHVFEDGELENLCKEIANVEIVKSFYDQGNHCVIIKKI